MPTQGLIPANKQTRLMVNELLSLTHAAGLHASGRPTGIWDGQFLCLQHVSALSASCLLTSHSQMFTQSGWIPPCEQYPHASFGSVKLFTSFYYASWRANNTAFHKKQMMAKLHTQIKNWHKSVSL